MNYKSLKWLPIALVLGLVLTNAADAGSPILSLDINQTNTPAETEEGFVSFTIADSGSTVNGITVEFGGTLDSRRRGAPAGVPLEQVYRDFIFSRPGAMTVALSGLAANTTYEITMYAWDTSSAQTRVADWTANGTHVLQTTFDGTVDPPAAEDDYAFTGRATADSTGTILLESAPGEGTREVSGASHPFAFLNGLVISSSEPITKARSPAPTDGALHEATWATLTWVPGDLALSHDLYLGDNFDDVNNGTSDTFQGNFADASVIVGFFGFPLPDGLVPGTTYYWRIDEVNDADPNSPWKGDVWSFLIPPRKAYNPSPADGVGVVLTDTTVSWTTGFGGKLGQMYFGKDAAEVEAGTGTTFKGPVTETTYDPGPLEEGATYYWRVDQFDGTDTHKGDVWSMTTVPVVAVTDPDLQGWWTMEKGAGTTVVDWSGHGNHGSFIGAPQWVDGYELGALEFDGAADAIEVPLQPSVTFEQGDSFSVSTWINTEVTPSPQDGLVGNYRTSTDAFWHLLANEDGGATIFVRDVGRANSTTVVSPNRINDGSWHHLAAIRDQQTKMLHLYVDGQLVAELDDATENINSGQSIWIGDHLNRYYDGLMDDVRIYNKPLTAEDVQQVMLGDTKLAGSPVPSRHASVDIRDIGSLSWTAGDAAASHDVYFGQDRDTVAGADNSAPEFHGNQAGTGLSLADLVEFGGGDYYWRIDEVAADGTVTAGTIWKFTVPGQLIVDDFESYNDIDEGEPGSNRVYLTWIDGFGTTTNGALAGNLDPPFMSQGRDSAQAMPLGYENVGKTSEATMTLTSGKDWTEHGVTKLSAWIRGDSANAADRIYIALNGGTAVYHDDPAATQLSGWKEWVIDLAAFGVDLTNVSSISIGIGTKGAPAADGGTGTVHFDDIVLTK